MNRTRGLLNCAVVGGVAAACLTACGGHASREGPTAPSAPSTRPAAAPRPVDSLSLRRQVGQLVVLSFRGLRAPDYVDRILRDGTAAGVVLFGGNVASPAQLRSLTRSLQRASGRAALIATDQEGGSIRIVRFAASDLGQAQQRTPDAARAEARSTGSDLRSYGINVNLAPIADVAAGQSSILRGRVYPGEAREVAARVGAATAAYTRAGVAATVKHFPGFGAATANTDDRPVTIDATPEVLRQRELVPFRAAIAAGAPLVMASHALYPRLDAQRIASQSPPVLDRLLRRELAFGGVAITGSIEAEAVLARSPVHTAAVRSVAAGVDLVLMTGPGSYRRVYPALLSEARRSPRFRRRVREAAGRVLELKRRLGLRAPD